MPSYCLLFRRMLVGAMRNTATIQTDCLYQHVVNRLGHGMPITEYNCVMSYTSRTHSMEAKHELFWTQADFGYVKEVVDSVMKLCMPKHKVRHGRIRLHTIINELTGGFFFELFEE